jgi:hypothetical protein
MSYDPECMKLADYFLDESVVADRQHLIGSLAQHIQDAIEDWLRGFEADAARDEPEQAA